MDLHCVGFCVNLEFDTRKHWNTINLLSSIIFSCNHAKELLAF